jgi:hypothetical protein
MHLRIQASCRPERTPPRMPDLQQSANTSQTEAVFPPAGGQRGTPTEQVQSIRRHREGSSIRQRSIGSSRNRQPLVDVHPGFASCFDFSPSLRAGAAARWLRSALATRQWHLPCYSARGSPASWRSWRVRSYMAWMSAMSQSRCSTLRRANMRCWVAIITSGGSSVTWPKRRA